MIRIEQETSANPLFTNDQFAKAAQIMATDWSLHYDLVESSYSSQDDDEDTDRPMLHLWTWPATRDETPTRMLIDETGEVILEEACDWITDEEWPAWA